MTEHCSFCGKSADEVPKLVRSQNDKHLICTECIKLAVEILKEQGIKPKKELKK